MKWVYEITGDTSYKGYQVTDEEAEEYRQMGWFVSNDPVIWSGEGAKMIVDMVLYDRPNAPEPAPPLPPSPKDIKAQANFQIIAQIEVIEAKQSRAVREYILTQTPESKQRLQVIEDQITLLRGQLQP